MATKSNYGKASFDGAVSDVPGDTPTSSDLAKSLRSAQSDGEDVLGSIIAHGTAGKPIGAGQDRAVAPTPYKTTFGCRDPNLNPAKVPGSISGGLDSRPPAVKQPTK
jgi:hypothetical protein